MITGAHAIVYSTDAEADRAFLHELLGTPSVDAGGGWLIFGLPPAEVAVHPTEAAAKHELYLMCDDIEATVSELTVRGVGVEGEVRCEGWGLLATVRMPSGAPLGIYQPRHPLTVDKVTNDTVSRDRRRSLTGGARG